MIAMIVSVMLFTGTGQELKIERQVMFKDTIITDGRYLCTKYAEEMQHQIQSTLQNSEFVFVVVACEEASNDESN